MTQQLRYLIILVLLAATSPHLFAQDQHLTLAETPGQIQVFVKDHFPDNGIVSVKKETTKKKKTEYDVKLKTGIKLEFDDAFGVKEIKAKSGIPSNLMLPKINDYVTTNYSGHKIIEWERKQKGHKIELDNDIDLYFSANGEFVRQKK